MTIAQPQELSKVSALFELEKGVRAATSLSSLTYLIVNQTSQLISFDQAVFISMSDSGPSPRVVAISSVASVDRTAPFVHWLERIASGENKGSERLVRHTVSSENRPPSDRDDWTSFSPPHVLWLPLISPLYGALGVLWLSRQTPWEDEKECILLDHIGFSYAHALQVFHRNYSFAKLVRQLLKRPIVLLTIVALSLGMTLPVTMTALGPAEVVPAEPYVVTSPMQGVVKEIIVEANQAIAVGQTVALLDDTEMRNAVALAKKALEVANAQLQRAERAAFEDVKPREALAELEAQFDLSKAELDFVEEQMSRAALISGKEGVAIVSRPEQWIGRPVSIGETILRIADENHVEVEIMLPVKDVILLEPGNRVRLFLDSNPLSPKEARILRFEYEPHLTELGTLAYLVTAELTDTKVNPRIGLRGTAKIYGKKVTLFYYIFRRPIMAVRQWWGW